MDDWVEFSAVALPPSGFVLVYVEFASESDPGAQPDILKAYWSEHDGYWRTQYGRLRGRVTHWRPLPPPPTPKPA